MEGFLSLLVTIIALAFVLNGTRSKNNRKKNNHNKINAHNSTNTSDNSSYDQ